MITEREARIDYAVRQTARVAVGNSTDDLEATLRQWAAAPQIIPTPWIAERFRRTEGLVLGYRRARA